MNAWFVVGGFFIAVLGIIVLVAYAPVLAFTAAVVIGGGLCALYVRMGRAS